MKHKLVLLSLLIVLLFNTAQSFAWEERGHSLVAEVAFNYLDAKTKQNVIKYLDGMTIEQAANWMDSIKKDKKYDYLKPQHYVNFEKGVEVNEPDGDNIIKALNTTLKELDNMKAYSKEEIKIRILYLFHLIGDLHQPLHVGYGEDRGGNTTQISFFGKGSNLHRLWDGDILEYKGTTLSDILKTNTFSKSEIAGLQKIDVIGWAKDSRSFLGNVYKIPNNKIDDNYINSNYPIIEKQILKGGLRLASVLEHYFKNVE